MIKCKINPYCIKQDNHKFTCAGRGTIRWLQGFETKL